MGGLSISMHDIKQLFLFQYIENFVKCAQGQSSNSTIIFPFIEPHYQYRTHGVKLLGQKDIRSVNILPYNRFLEDSNQWKQQMIMAFLPWRYSNVDSDNGINFGGIHTEIQMSDKTILKLYDILKQIADPHFDRYINQLTKMKEAKRNIIQNNKEDGPKLGDISEYSEWNLESDLEYDVSDDVMRMLNTEEIDLIKYHQMLPDSNNDTAKCIQIAKSLGLFDIDDNLCAIPNFIGNLELDVQKLEDIAKWNTPVEITPKFLPDNFHIQRVKNSVDQQFAFNIIKQVVDQQSNNSNRSASMKF